MSSGDVMLAAPLLTEPVFVPNTNIDGISHIEDAGDGRRTVVLYSKRKSPNGESELIMEARIVATYPVILAFVVAVMLHMGAEFRASVCKAVCGAVAVH